MCELKPGDEVVFLGHKLPDPPDLPPSTLEEGKVYTVAAVYPPEQLQRDSRAEFGLDIEGHVSPLFAYRASDFRKVQKRSTDTGMAILKGLLEGNNINITAREMTARECKDTFLAIQIGKDKE